MKRILVAGGAGFVGSHLCDRLLAEGHHVICLDNLLTGSHDNVSHNLDHPRFEFMEHDIVEPLKIRGKLDEIYNLACPASPVHYQADPHYTVMISVMGVYHLLALAREKGARILQASTSEVYGDPLKHPQTESDNGNVNCTGPRACYDEGKRCAEAMLFDALRQHGTNIKVARIFNTYGPRMHEKDGRVVSNFAVQVLTGQPITVYGEGRQTRSFCYVDDLVDGLMKLMNSPDGVHGPVNLGNPDEVTILEFAHRIAAHVGVEAEILLKPLPVDDPQRRRPDIRVAREVLGWAPSTVLEEGLSRTVDYFRAKLNREDRLSRKVQVQAQPAPVRAAAATEVAV
ncbi:UDP-glucuronate decarboxylase [Faunimonas pinastri]|uniref:UDP-glucuronate decarboxylase n=1 Tax=Faunimonas pinastri TaxID=1855383 RepID=A0A1H9JXY1_9HYPH|nr:UDP-glucuronic acid decarboxylase family protein [Faunimonas pinastri]SEQ91650.1 UDP-glucuronate decarboxylase [Faunimonas pinastri]